MRAGGGAAAAIGRTNKACQRWQARLCRRIATRPFSQRKHSGCSSTRLATCHVKFAVPEKAVRPCACSCKRCIATCHASWDDSYKYCCICHALCGCLSPPAPAGCFVLRQPRSAAYPLGSPHPTTQVSSARREGLSRFAEKLPSQHRMNLGIFYRTRTASARDMWSAMHTL